VRPVAETIPTKQQTAHTMSTQTKAAIDYFQYKTLLTIPEGTEPTCAQLEELQKQYNANARAVPSNRGGGKYGHLALVMTPEAYKKKTGHDFIPPTAPPTTPGIPEGTKSTQAALLTKLHEMKQKEWDTYRDTIQELNNQLVAAVDDKLIGDLADDGAFIDVSPIEILQHLWKQFGKITKKRLQSNSESMVIPWTINEPL
jgi:hypothetical protein